MEQNYGHKIFEIFFGSIWYNIYINCIILLKKYKHSLPFFPDVNAGIRKMPGIKHKKIGYSKPNTKLITVSLIKCIWVFL